MTLKITPLKIYREWFIALEVDWANEISENVVKDVLLTSSFFVSDNDDDAYAGLESIDDFHAYLLYLIDKNIEIRNIDNERLLCQQLLISTSYTLIKIARKKDGVYRMLQEKQMENLLTNDLERATFYQKSLDKNIENRLAAKDLKIKWDTFTEEYFNMELFSQREIC